MKQYFKLLVVIFIALTGSAIKSQGLNNNNDSFELTEEESSPTEIFFIKNCTKHPIAVSVRSPLKAVKEHIKGELDLSTRNELQPNEVFKQRTPLIIPQGYQYSYSWIYPQAVRTLAAGLQYNDMPLNKITALQKELSKKEEKGEIAKNSHYVWVFIKESKIPWFFGNVVIEARPKNNSTCPK